MIKTNLPEVKKVVPKIVKIDKVGKVGKKKKAVKRVYKAQMYVPRNRSTTRHAIIEYIDKKIPQKSAQVNIKYDLRKQCRDTKQYLIGQSRKVYLRYGPSVGSKVAKRVYRNYVIPYKRVVNANWFEVCDGTFVHKNEATYISNIKVEGLLSGSKTKK